MGKVTVPARGQRQFDIDLKNKLGQIIEVAALKSRPLLIDQAAILSKTIAEAPEFKDLSGRLVGEFGFTPEEVTNLNRIFQLLVPQNEVTKFETKITPNEKSIILEWVDFEALKDHAFARHPLTRHEPAFGGFITIQTVSWVDWFENGVTVRDWDFNPNLTGRNKRFSRSGKGLMFKKQGGLWSYAPTGLFHKTAEDFATKHVEKFKRDLVLLISKIKVK